jgi:hypothetical protein
MEVVEALDREVIVERAEALRSQFAGLRLSGRASGALERELQGIITNDPGNYIDGQRPLAGLTLEALISELHSPAAGAVGRVQGVGSAVITELRAAMPTEQAAQAAPTLEASAEDAAAPADEAQAAAPEASEAPRRRGRPKGSKNKPRSPVVEAAPVAEAAPAPVVAPVAEAEPAPVAAPAPDAALAQLMRLWPELHPHARRALVLYAGTLLAEV